METNQSLELTILMPCLNEAETVGICIQKAQAFLESHDIDGEILVADNGSMDGSQDIAQREGARVINIEQKGYGSALLGGIQSAKGKYVIMGDADDSYDFSNLEGFLTELRDGYDLVMGNRFKGGIETGAMPFLHRYLGNPVLSAIGRLFFKTPVSDFHCGLRGFRRDSILGLDLRTTGMEFASEMVVKFSLFNCRVAEVPTTLSPAGRTRAPHLRTWQDGWRHLRFLLLYSPRWLFLYPGIVLMLVGLTISAALIIGPISLGGRIFDIHTLLYSSMAIILGYQAILFAVFAKVFAISEGLLPKDQRLDQLFRYVRLETGLMVGVILIAMGLFLTGFAYWIWSSRLFGGLEPSQTFRIAIPAVLSLILGVQTILYSFFLSVLGLKRRI
jgi:glycosyltransferase involved in cell wall biosynthesis